MTVMPKRFNPATAHPAFLGQHPATGFQARYIESFEEQGQIKHEIGLSATESLVIAGNLFYAVTFAARYWSLFLHRPVHRVAQGGSRWPIAFHLLARQAA